MICRQPIKEFYCEKPKGHYCAHISLTLGPMRRQFNFVRNLATYFTQNYFNIAFRFTRARDSIGC
jgi:hypothetical protein